MRNDRPNNDQGRFPRSHVDVDPPWLVIAWPAHPEIRLDVRLLDGIGSAGTDLILTVEDLDVAMHLADGSEATEYISAQLLPYTRLAPITTKEVYEDARRQLDGLRATGGPRRDHELLVGEAPVYRSGDYLRVGDLAFRISDVEEYAASGANLPIPSGGMLQASIALLVVAAEQRTGTNDLTVLAKRIADYEVGHTPTHPDRG